MAAWLTRWALRFPRSVLLLTVAITLLLGAGATRLRSVSHFDGTLPADDPELLRFAELESLFGSEQFALLAFGCGAPHPCESIFEPEALGLVVALTDLARGSPGVEEVTSLATLRFLVGDESSLGVERAGNLSTEPGAARLRELVSRDPTLLGTIVGKDLRATSVVAYFDASLSDGDRNDLTLELLERARSEAREAGFELYATGSLVFGALTRRNIDNDLVLLTPLMIGLLVAFLLWVFRDPSSVGMALAAVATPSVWVFGLMGWTNRPVSPMTSTLPILILVVGVTDAVHFLVRFRELRGTADGDAATLLEVAREVGPPTTVTALTASLGFLSFLAGPIPIVRDFGVAAAVGVMGGWLLTFGLIPVLAMLRRSDAPRSVPPAFALGNRVLDRVLGLAHGHPGVVLATGLVAVGISAVGMTRLVADSDTLELLGERDYMAQSVRFIRERLGPAARIDVVYELPPGGSLADPEHLRRLERVEELLLEETRVEPVLSVLPILRLANRELTGGPFEVPADRLQAAQLLLLVESAAPEVLHRVVTPDGRMAHLAAPHVYGSASAGKAQLERLRAQVGSVLDGHAGWWITGGALLSSHIGDLILENQLASFSTAFLTIFAVIFVFVRSFPLGALGMIPNVLPVVVVLGLMGLLDVKLDVATAMIASIVLGVSVDDTVYFLLHFQRARGMGASVPEAVSHTFALAGKPALFCAIVLALGFFVLGLSNFQSLAYFGLFSALAVLVAAVAELFLLPALLALTAGRRRED